MKNIIGIAIILFCINVNGVFAQQHTAYQKKLADIAQKYLKILSGYDKPLSINDKLQLDMLSSSEDAYLSIFGFAILGYSANHTDAETKRIVAQIGNEIKLAEKLKTSVDFKREKDAKEQKKREEYEKIQKEQQDAYDRTDIGSLKLAIKNAIEEWNKKGEFEKQADYEERLRLKSKEVFMQICEQKVKSRTSMIIDLLNSELLPYDSESETFTVIFKLKNIEWQSRIVIPLSKAEVFKNYWGNLYTEVDDYDWCFVNKSLCPILVNMINKNDNENYKFGLSLQKTEDISFSFNEFELSNPYLKDVIFNYSEVKRNVELIALEKQRLDSIKYMDYCQKLDSVFNDYNIQLLQNPYNTSRRKMTGFMKMEKGDNYIDGFNLGLSAIETDYKKICKDVEYEYYSLMLDSVFLELNKQLLKNPYNVAKDTMLNYIKMGRDGNLNENFKSCSIAIKSNFEKEFNNFSKKMESQNPLKFCQIFFSLNPEMKSKADKKYLDCRCIYSNRLTFDIDFINGTLKKCDCREKEYAISGQLFSSKMEFDTFYDKGEDLLQEEISIRRYKTLASKVESLDFSIVNKKETSAMVAGRNLLYEMTGIGMQGKADDLELVKYFIQKIAEFKNLSYYSKIIDFTIDVNKGLNKEWTKKGYLFSSKIEFYESFISGNYKKDLKEKK